MIIGIGARTNGSAACVDRYEVAKIGEYRRWLSASRPDELKKIIPSLKEEYRTIQKIVVGAIDTPPGVFSIAWGARYQDVYRFPQNSSEISAIGLTPVGTEATDHKKRWSVLVRPTAVGHRKRWFALGSPRVAPRR